MQLQCPDRWHVEEKMTEEDRKDGKERVAGYEQLVFVWLLHTETRAVVKSVARV